MRAKDDLFKLIKSMSKSEKRYFSLDAKKSGKTGSRYLELFRFLSEADVYDEERLKKKFPKNLSSDKNYLYDAVLRSMRDYRSVKSKAAQIKEKLQDSRFLFERGLYNQCDARLREANDIAVELGDELMILEVARERLLTIKSNKEKNFVTQVEGLLADKSAALEKVCEYFKYSDAYYETIVKVAKNFHLPPEEREQISLPAFFAEEADLPKSSQAQRRYLQTRALFHQLKGEKKKVLEYFKKTAEWWKENPAFREEEYTKYISDWFNLIYACFANDLYEDAKEYIERMKADKPVQLHDRRLWEENVFLNEFMYFLNTKDYDAAVAMTESLHPLKAKKNFTNFALIAANAGILFFQKGNYEKSRKWLEKIIQDPKLPMRTDAQVIVRMLNLICMYETDEIENLDNEMRSVQRFLRKINLTADTTEGKILRRLGKIFRAAPYEAEAEKASLADFLQQNFRKAGSKDDLIEPLLPWSGATVGV